MRGVFRLTGEVAGAVKSSRPGPVSSDDPVGRSADVGDSDIGDPGSRSVGFNGTVIGSRRFGDRL